MNSLPQQLIDARRRTTRLTQDLSGAQLLGPRLPIVNPFLWELGHVAWFQERWCLRRRDDGTLAPSVLDSADALYDSSRVPHHTRWDLPLPDAAATRAYMAQVLERVLQRLEREPDNERLAYFAQLVAYHEDMHDEAFHYMRQTLRLPAPDLDPVPGVASGAAPAGDVDIAGGLFRLGAEPGKDFVFDNEKWAHEIEIPQFRIAPAPVTNAEYLHFVEEGGYRRREFWSGAGWRWKEDSLAIAPGYWARCDGVWLERRFDRMTPLEPDLPVMNVCWHEAQAYCRYAGRRLPTEAEWELAAAGGAKRRFPWGGTAPGPQHANLGSDRRVAVGALAQGDSACGCRQMLGNVWEWTESVFLPYPGFERDPYEDYSEPWFGTRKVLRGGSFATPARLIRNTWRNFFTPERRDVFAGLRTCATRPG